jgi:Tfp pilus assembly protein PilO
MNLNRLRREIGLSGLVALIVLAAAVAFSNFVVKPLEERSEALKSKVSRQAPAAAQASGAAEKVAAVYEFLNKDESTTDWLAKLHGIGVATGVQLKSAAYRTQTTEGRIVRYEIVLPVAGSYGQIRDFLKRSLAEIPVMSVDQLNLKRGDGKNDAAIQAEMRLTLHMVNS